MTTVRHEDKAELDELAQVFNCQLNDNPELRRKGEGTMGIRGRPATESGVRDRDVGSSVRVLKMTRLSDSRKKAANKNPLFEKIPKDVRLGGDIQSKRDLS